MEHIGTDNLIISAIKRYTRDIGLTTKEISEIVGVSKVTAWRHLIWLENRGQVQSAWIANVRVYTLPKSSS